MKETMEALINNIDRIQGEIFKNYSAECIQRIIKVAEEIQNLLPNLNIEKQSHIIELLRHLMLALDNKDYLLVADILEYEFKPLLITV